MYTNLLNQHLKILELNKVPKNKRGDDLNKLEYEFNNKIELNNFIEVLLSNNQFKGELILISDYFDDSIGYKIAKIIENNNITQLKIHNRNNPFGYRITSMIGKALSNNTSLKNLEAFMDVDETTSFNICEFLSNKQSVLESIKYAKITDSLLDNLNKYISKKSKLKSIIFYYEPMRIPDLLYCKIK